MNCQNEMKKEEMIVTVNAIYAFTVTGSTGFEPVASRFTGTMLYQLSYEATDVGSRSIVGSYVQTKIWQYLKMLYLRLSTA